MNISAVFASETTFRISQGETLWGKLNQVGMAKYVSCVINTLNINPYELPDGYTLTIPGKCMSEPFETNKAYVQKIAKVTRVDNLDDGLGLDYEFIQKERNDLNTTNLIIYNGSYLKNDLRRYLRKRGIRLEWDLQCDIKSNIEYVYKGNVEEVLKNLSLDLEDSEWNLTIEYLKQNLVRIYSNDHEIKC